MKISLQFILFINSLLHKSHLLLINLLCHYVILASLDFLTQNGLE